MFELYKYIVDGEVSDYITFLFMLFVVGSWIYFTAKSVFSAYRIEMVEKVVEYNFRLRKQFEQSTQYNENVDPDKIKDDEQIEKMYIDSLNLKYVEFDDLFIETPGDEDNGNKQFFVTRKNVKIGSVYYKEGTIIEEKTLHNGIFNFPDSDSLNRTMYGIDGYLSVNVIDEKGTKWFHIVAFANIKD